MPGETRTLAETVAGLRCGALSPQTLEAVRAQCLDTIGALVYGAVLPGIGPLLIHWLGPGGNVNVPGAPAAGPLPAAAGAAAALAHAAEIDSIHSASAVCVGAAIIPPLLILASERQRSGEAFTESVVAGYEVAARLGSAIHGQAQLGRGRWPTALCAPAAVAAGAAKLLSLDAPGIERSIGTAALGTSGLLAAGRNEPETRHLLLAGAVRAGMEAALAEEAGFAGPERMLEGRDGLCALFDDAPDYNALTRATAAPAIDAVGIKPYGCGRQTQAAVRLLIDLLKEAGQAPDAIASVKVRLPPQAGFFDRPDPPKSRMAAISSVQFTLALAATVPDFLPADFEDRRTDEAILRLMQRIEVTFDAALSEAYPNRWPAQLWLDFRNGRSLDGLRPDAPGDTGDPLSSSEIEQKFRSLAAPLIGTAAAQYLIDAVGSMPDLPSVGPLLTPLQSTTRE